jgi:hypothetical protein
MLGSSGLFGDEDKVRCLQESRLLIHLPNDAPIYTTATSTTSGFDERLCKSDADMIMPGRTRPGPSASQPRALPLRGGRASRAHLGPAEAPFSWLLIDHRIHHMSTLSSACLILSCTPLASQRQNAVTRSNSTLDRGYVCSFADGTVSRNQSTLLLGAEAPGGLAARSLLWSISANCAHSLTIREGAKRNRHTHHGPP